MLIDGPGNRPHISDIFVSVSQSFRQVAEESGVEMASSKSSLDFCAASAQRIDDALAKVERDAAERDELGERIAGAFVPRPVWTLEE